MAFAVTVEGNRVSGNTRNGIVIERPSSTDRVRSNIALDNGSADGAGPGFDLADENPGCDANTWPGNTYRPGIRPASLTGAWEPS